MLQSLQWRPVVMQSLRNFFSNYAPNLLGEELVEPNPLQINALKALEFYRSKGWKKGVVILPTGTGKTILSALDARIFRGKVLFIVHRLDILKQSISAYKKVWNQATIGILTGESRENELNCDILFASKDTLRQTTELTKYRHDEFDYIVIDEVYHGQTPSYREIFSYFKPRFMLGMTATPDRISKSYLTPSQLEEIEQWLIPLERRNISELERHLIEEKDWLITCCLFAPYGPKENPVEAIWLQVKNFIRRFYYRCRNFSIAKKLFQLFFKFNLFNPPNLEKYDAFVQMI